VGDSTPIADAKVVEYLFFTLNGVRALILNLVTETVYFGHFW